MMAAMKYWICNSADSMITPALVSVSKTSVYLPKIYMTVMCHLYQIKQKNKLLTYCILKASLRYTDGSSVASVCLAMSAIYLGVTVTSQA